MSKRFDIIGGGLWRRGSRGWKWARRNLAVRIPRRRPRPPGLYLTMFDSVTPAVIPARAEAVAGYVGGRWPTYRGLLESHPHAKHLSIAIAASEAADCLDIEAGDASPAQASAWLRGPGRHHPNTPKPVVYTSVSQADTVIATLAAGGFPRSSYLLWTAHYTGLPHLCGPKCSGAGVRFAGHADATQYSDRAEGKNLDASLVRAGFFRPG